MRFNTWIGRGAAIATCLGSLYAAAPAHAADTQYGQWYTISETDSHDAPVCGERTRMNLTWDFVRQFRAGFLMKADFGGLRWTVGLQGSLEATADMAACADNPSSRFAS
jgi:hypothetical protein